MSETNSTPPVGRYRWVVVALLFVASTINYLDRQVLGLLKPTLEEDLNWTETDYSHVVMAFTAAYAIGYPIFGRMIDKFGTKVGYAVSIIIWSIAAMFHAAARTTFGFGVARAALGLGEAGNFPAAIKAVAEWFPKKERALATGIFNSGTNIGAMIAPLAVPWILAAYGWQEAFIITGAVGFIWLIFWWIYYEIPAKQRRVSQAEVAYIYSDNEAEETGEDAKIRYSSLFGIKETWVYIVGKFMTDPIWWFFLFWLPSYFAETFNLDLKKPSLHLAVLYTATTVGSIAGGYLSSTLIKRGWPVFKARKTSMFIIACMVVPIILARYVTDIWAAVALISLAAGAHQAWSANMFTTASDMFPKKAVSSVVGLGGIAGSLGGFLFPIFVGYILDSYKLQGNLVGGYNIIFTVCGFAYLIAWAIMHFLAPRPRTVNI